jgi:putative transposase
MLAVFLRASSARVLQCGPGPYMTGLFCTSRIERLEYRKEPETCRKRRSRPSKSWPKLRQIEVMLSQGKTVPLACKEAGIVDQTYYRWRREFGGLQLEQAKKLKDLQKENAQLKRALATITLEKQVLKDIAEGNF